MSFSVALDIYKQSSSNIGIYLFPQAIEAIASSSGGIQTLIPISHVAFLEVRERKGTSFKVISIFNYFQGISEDYPARHFLENVIVQV